MDDPNITMEEYIRLEEEKARRHGQTFNWQTATFGKVENYEDEDDCSIDFENEFPAIVFDNTLTTIPSEPTVCPPNENKVDFRISLEESDDEDYTVIFDYLDDLDYFRRLHNLEINLLVSSECIDKFNLIDEASLSEFDEEIVSRFNDLCNIIHTDDSKSKKENDDNVIVADQRHPWLRYQIQEYTEGIRHSYEQRLETIWSRPVNRVHVLDFEGLTPKMRRLFGIRAPLVREFILEFLRTCRMSDTEMGLDVVDTLDRLIPDKGDLRDYWMEISSDRDFLCPAPSYVLIRDPVRRLCHRMIAYSIFGRGQAPEKVTDIDLFYLRSMDRGTTNIPHLLAQYLFRHAKGRKSGARLSGGHFIGRLAMHFRLVSDEGLRGLQVRWHMGLGSPGPERQQGAAAGAHEADEAGPAAKEGAQEISVPTPAPAPAQAPPLAPQPRTIFTTEQSRVSTWLITCMTQLMDTSGQTYQPFDNTLIGSLHLSFQRHVRLRTSDASTFATPHTDAQPDP
ncbi:hypothetical protein Tco_0031997 [Tanacetum coccineum]